MSAQQERAAAGAGAYYNARQRDEALGLGELAADHKVPIGGLAFGQAIPQMMNQKQETNGRHFDITAVEMDAQRTGERFHELHRVLDVLRRPMSEVTVEEYARVIKSCRRLGYDV